MTVDPSVKVLRIRKCIDITLYSQQNLCISSENEKLHRRKATWFLMGVPSHREFIDDATVGKIPNERDVRKSRESEHLVSYQISRSRMRQPSFRLFVV